MPAKRKHEEEAESDDGGSGNEEEEGGSGNEDEEEDGDKVAIMLTKVHVDSLDPTIGMMLPYPFYDHDIGVEVITNRLRREAQWDEEKSTKFTIRNRKGAEYAAMRLDLSFVTSSLPPNEAGRKAGGPSRGPSLVEVFGGAARVDDVTENSCSVILPVSFVNQSVTGHYTFRRFHRVRKAWEIAAEGDIKLVEGDVNSDQPLMLHIIFDSIYS